MLDIPDPLHINQVIKRIRESHPQMVDIFTCGGCFDFYLILQAIWPIAIPFYDNVSRHVITDIEGRLYDIQGDRTDDFATNRDTLIHLPHPSDCPWDDWVCYARRVTSI